MGVVLNGLVFFKYFFFLCFADNRFEYNMKMCVKKGDDHV